MQIIQDRRQLHQIPELDRQLPMTFTYLTRALSQLRCHVFSPMDGALCAFFDFGATDAIAFRSDADALPITEKTGAVYASTHPGRMHACGHDGHMAILLELARQLNEIPALRHNVLLVFQGAEETTGGAKDLCATGVFETYAVKAIFALHLWPGLAAGTIASRREEMMSRSCEVTVDITGRSAHIAKAWEGLDAMAAAVAFHTRVAAMEAAFPENVFRLLKFGKLECGTVRNALAGHAHLEGSLRAFHDETFEALRAGILAIGAEIEKETGCTVQIHMNDGYPAVINPGSLYDLVETLVDFQKLEAPSMITEDFSWYQKTLPGMFFFLGTGDSPALHADTFDFDESILLKGADFFRKLAEQFP